jgi:hypothetical protein
MSTNIEIRKFVQRHHGFIPKNGWIAHVKALRGLPTRRRRTAPVGVVASNRARPKSVRPSKRRSGISV